MTKLCETNCALLIKKFSSCSCYNDIKIVVQLDGFTPLNLNQISTNLKFQLENSCLCILFFRKNLNFNDNTTTNKTSHKNPKQTNFVI